MKKKEKWEEKFDRKFGVNPILGGDCWLYVEEGPANPSEFKSFIRKVHREAFKQGFEQGRAWQMLDELERKVKEK